ncbi:MAG: 1-deoxy-D-xylulose-5-phosphate reductoisomerase [Proteobacteria bacterium]|nr:1-deoxy-D-xylulose-5-phosphate reductoisomerase [Pseudomonadota bacterium]
MGIAVLGSTGSIGRNTLDVVARHPERFRVVALSAHRSWQKLVEQASLHRPQLLVLLDEGAAEQARAALAARQLSIPVHGGSDALAAAAAHADVDIVMAAIVGAAGLASTLAAVRAGKRVLLANKEALVMTGPLLMREVRERGAQLIPIDSEHNAMFQCMPASFRPGSEPAGLTRLILTASGGPFRLMPAAELESVTPAQAVAHPKWSMGPKISVDSATLMNKGLEIIEASWLFGVPESRVEVLVHPQSVVHSLVEYADGSILAQMGAPDMRTPIAQALAWPERIGSGVQSLRLEAIRRLDFEPPDLERFPSLTLARAAARAGGTAPALLNAANEVAVQAFLDRRLNFTGIAAVIDRVLQQLVSRPAQTLGDVLDADVQARHLARAIIEPARGAFS